MQFTVWVVDDQSAGQIGFIDPGPFREVYGDALKEHTVTLKPLTQGVVDDAERSVMELVGAQFVRNEANMPRAYVVAAVSEWTLGVPVSVEGWRQLSPAVAGLIYAEVLRRMFPTLPLPAGTTP